MATGTTDSLVTDWPRVRLLQNPENHETWRWFFKTYRRLIAREGERQGLNAGEAEELVQDVISEVLARMSAFKADPEFGSFKNWLRQLTRWRIADKLRKHRREAELFVSHAPAAEGDTDIMGIDSVERTVEPTAAGHEKVWDIEWNSNVAEIALERLKRKVNPKHYQIFFLYVVKEEPMAKVCRALGVSAAKVYLVKHRLRRELRKLRAQIESGTWNREIAAT